MLPKALLHLTEQRLLFVPINQTSVFYDILSFWVSTLLFEWLRKHLTGDENIAQVGPLSSRRVGNPSLLELGREARLLFLLQVANLFLPGLFVSGDYTFLAVQQRWYHTVRVLLSLLEMCCQSRRTAMVSRTNR